MGLYIYKDILEDKKKQKKGKISERPSQTEQIKVLIYFATFFKRKTISRVHQHSVYHTAFIFFLVYTIISIYFFISFTASLFLSPCL